MFRLYEELVTMPNLHKERFNMGINDKVKDVPDYANTVFSGNRGQTQTHFKISHC